MAGKIQTVTEQIYQEIRKEILNRTIPPGDKLTIKMLNERYGVSSSPIREALAHLQQDGLIDYKPNVGMSVIKLTEEDLNELFVFMSELDSIALRFAMESGRADELLDKLKKLQKQAAAFIDDYSGMWNKLSDDFHIAFYEYAGNSRLSEAADKIRSQFTLFTHSYEEDLSNRESILAEHQWIIDALADDNIPLADERMRKHELSSKDKALEILAFENNQI